MHRRLDTYLKGLLDPERMTFYETVCRFAEAEIAPHLVSWEREHQLLPTSAIAAMAEIGLFGVTVEERFGGAGGTLLDLVLVGLALGYHSQSVAITPGAAASLGEKPLQMFGSEGQKTAHLPDLASGKRMFVFGLSEPGRGSDAANPQVTATRVPGGWRLKGEKCWSTNARWASHAIVHALTAPQGRAGHRATCFIVPMGQPNVHYLEMSGKEAWLQSSTGSIVFEDVEVGEEAVLGEVNEGFRIMSMTLTGGRLFIAALALASLAYALDRCRTYAQERLQFDDKPIGRFQRVQDVLVDMDVTLEQGLVWLMHLLRLHDRGELSRESAAKIKIESSRRASAHLAAAMEIAGGIGCVDEFGLSRHHRDLFVCRVGEGSNFVLQSLVARSLMPNQGSAAVAVMADVVLATFNARWAHAALGLRYLLANLGPLAAKTKLEELTLEDLPVQAAERILANSPKVVGVGVYVWNARASRDLVALLKRLRPEVAVAVGGPEMWVGLEHPAAAEADYVIVGEAEHAFRELATGLCAGERPSGKLIECPPLELDSVALPYELFDEVDLTKRVVQLESGRGCPFACDFCLSALTSGVRSFAEERILAAVERLWERGLRRFRFVDRSFNAAPLALPLLEWFLRRPTSDYFVHLEITPTRLADDFRRALSRFKAGSLQLEVGVQSFDEEVAHAVHRPHSASAARETLRFLRQETTAHIHADLIVGLPYESMPGVGSSFDELVQLAPHEVQVGILKRLPGAPIARHDAAAGMVYNPEPPYEVLQSGAIDFSTMQRLKRFARYWDLVANSGRFPSLLPLLCDSSPFSDFLALSDWLYSRTGRTHALGLERLQRLLAEFLESERGVSSEVVHERLLADSSRSRRQPGAATPPRQARHRS